MEAKVAVIMGSESDAVVMDAAVAVLQKFGVPYMYKVVSAHRSPDWMYEFARAADEQQIKVIIAGAGGAAHLPGMVAALCTIPVIGVPVKSSNSLDGWDSLLSIAQMPKDIPVATMAVNGAHNAALFAVEILAVSQPNLKAQLATLKKENAEKVETQNISLAGRNVTLG